MATKTLLGFPGNQEEAAERRHLALNAAWEIEALAIALADLVNQDAENLAMRGMVLRTRDLAGQIMSAIDDALYSVDLLHENIVGTSSRAVAEKNYS